MIIVTTNDIPGYRVTNVLGEVMGLTVRALNFGAGITAGFRAIGGGELPEYTRTMHDSRIEVMNRMAGEAQSRGGNAILAMRFDANAIGSYTEMCAYGTAVVIEPLPATTPQPAPGAYPAPTGPAA
ncbi:YbjQ family protein [Frondihabitans australicus]|uniref:UPF0145 protein C8E83_0694 n=1 Tax=Frondihabitans australicus TaxID=386892 RepID=A0A495IE37_9MICO|nr:YbjQ family protein [Frondihabitans australicus]RKR73601.1 uncharacterized protein YbjQ (UPF0145 family) [Frondihabitans australicus]